MKKVNDVYLNELEKIPLLTQEEERAYAQKAVKGDKAAQNKLVEANLRFVLKIAHQYEGYMDLEDLIDEGNMGLMHAATKFNPDNNTRFITYAVWWIRAYIQKAVRETATGIRFPSSKFADMKKEEWRIASLDTTVPGSEGESLTLGGIVKDEKNQSPEEYFWEKEACNQISELIKILSPREKKIIVKRYGLDGKEPMSLSAIAKVMGYSKERIRQIEQQAICSMKALAEMKETYVSKKSIAA